jgi:hypothetical protein
MLVIFFDRFATDLNDLLSFPPFCLPLDQWVEDSLWVQLQFVGLTQHSESVRYGTVFPRIVDSVRIGPPLPILTQVFDL